VKIPYQIYLFSSTETHHWTNPLPAHPLPAVQIFGFSPALAAWVNKPYVNQCCFHLKTKFFLLLLRENYAKLHSHKVSVM